MGPAGSRVTPTETNIEKDLGVSTANDLNPAVQCEQAAAKARREVRMIPSQDILKTWMYLYFERYIKHM